MDSKSSITVQRLDFDSTIALADKNKTHKAQALTNRKQDENDQKERKEEKKGQEIIMNGTWFL